MRVATFAICLLATLPAAAEPVQAAGDYRTCTPEHSEAGRGLVAKSCGTLAVPDFSGVEFQSAGEMEDARSLRDGFLLGVKVYGRCVSDFITAQQQPSTSADSPAADQAACAHSWAEDKATDVIRGFGQACIAYANRSVLDIRLPVYDGPCYPETDETGG
jgi:hypothetical protein